MRVAIGGLLVTWICLGCGPTDGGLGLVALGPAQVTPSNPIDPGSTKLPVQGGPRPLPAPVVQQPPPQPQGCADLFAQELLPTYEIEVTPDAWARLEEEFLRKHEREAAGLDVSPWHPIVFRYGSEVVHTAMIRLRGKSSWDQTIEKDPNPKMQFLISFNELDKAGRFHGLRKLALDMPRIDRTYLRQRIALSYLRELGIPAQCANNARVEINGEYYGLFTNLEPLDKAFLQRVFSGADGGDLWKYGKELKTNEESSDRQRHQSLFGVTTVEETESLVDLEASIRMWAADAMIPNGDGYFAGAHNFYLYDHPERGFVWLPYDLDATFEHVSPQVDPVDWKWSRGEPGLHWTIVMAHPGWLDRYVGRLEEAWAAYDVQELERRLAEWSAQIAEAAAADPRRPFPMEELEEELQTTRAFYTQRANFIRAWIDCYRGGNEACSH